MCNFTDLGPLGAFVLLGVGEGRQRDCGKHGVVWTRPGHQLRPLGHHDDLGKEGEQR